MKELKPCPFCGSEDLSISGNDFAPFVSCECGATGPCEERTEKEIGTNYLGKVIKGWNKRPVDSEEEEDWLLG